MNKDVKAVRYSYSITTALLLGGAALTLVTGYPAGAQVAQNERLQIGQASVGLEFLLPALVGGYGANLAVYEMLGGEGGASDWRSAGVLAAIIFTGLALAASPLFAA